MLSKAGGVSKLLSPVAGAVLAAGPSRLPPDFDGLVRDTFTDADGTTLQAHTPERGTWLTADGGVWSITGNRAHADGTLLSAVAMETGEANVTIEFDVQTTSPTDGTPLVAFRHVDGVNLYTVYRNGSGFCEIREHINVGENGTVLATSAATWITDSDEHHLRIVVSGHSVAVYTDEVLTLQADDIMFAFVTATEHGLISNLADTFFDNFEVTAYVDPSALTGDYGADSFTNSDGVDLTVHTPELGSWEVLLGTFQFDTGRLHCIDSTLDAAAVMDAGVSDVAVEVDWIPAAAGMAHRLLSLRAVDNSNKWVINRNGANQLQIIEKTAGSNTARATSVGSYTANARVRAECSGSTIIILVDGVEAVRYESATAHQAATKFGVASNRSDNYWDNFVLEAI